MNWGPLLALLALAAPIFGLVLFWQRRESKAQVIDLRVSEVDQ